jgi:Uma2 family endonuclease
MNILRRAMTLDEYLAWGAGQSERVRSELINGQVVLMAPERARHIEAKFAAAVALKDAVARAGLRCYALADGATIRIDDHTAYEPDALVYCGDKIPDDAITVADPLIVVEVLSPATAHTDTSAKLIGYFKVPSVTHYLIVDPERRVVTHHARGSRPILLTGGMLRLDPPGMEVDVDAFLQTA